MDWPGDAETGDQVSCAKVRQLTARRQDFVPVKLHSDSISGEQRIAALHANNMAGIEPLHGRSVQFYWQLHKKIDYCANS